MSHERRQIGVVGGRATALRLGEDVSSTCERHQLATHGVVGLEGSLCSIVLAKTGLFHEVTDSMFGHP